MIRDSIFLIGFMGTGKTSVGKQLAIKVGSPFVDLDEYIEEMVEMSIPEIFESHGEKEFRSYEAKALNDCINKSLVVATGGGIVESENLISIMSESGTTVYLETPFDTIYERIKSDTNRPITKEGIEGLKARLERRLPLYKQAAITINTKDKSIEEIVEEIQQYI